MSVKMAILEAIVKASKGKERARFLGHVTDDVVAKLCR
jgi:hypothetical protein